MEELQKDSKINRVIIYPQQISIPSRGRENERYLKFIQLMIQCQLFQQLKLGF